VAELRILQGVFASSGGVRVHVRALARELEQRGHRVHTIEIGASPEGAAEGLPMTYGPLAGLRARTTLDEALERIDPDVVHLHSPNQVVSPVLVRRLRRSRPTVVTWHDVRPFCFLGTRRFAPTGEVCPRVCGLGCITAGCYRPRAPLDLARMPRRIALDAWAMREFRALPRIIVVSRFLEQLAIEHGFAGDRTEVIPGFVQAVPRPPQRDKGEAPLILFIGRLVPEKGAHVLLEALHGLRELSWHADLVGEGPERKALAERARVLGLGDRVVFTGHLDPDARDARLARSSLVVSPGLIPEGLGMVGIEALGFGRPVVSFGLGGQSDWLVDGETGLRAREGDAAHLAEQIGRLLERPAWARELGEHGRALVERRFRADRCVPLILEVYRAAIQMYRHRGR
jgi:glycosyltransferase involved in cell wall biosynthesis